MDDSASTSSPLVLATLTAFLDRCGADRPEAGALERELARLGPDVSTELVPFARYDDAGYQRVRLALGDHYEILLLCWRSGQASPIHDHGRSVCGVRVLAGTATETRFELTPSGRLRVSATRRLGVGDTSTGQDTDMHVVSNDEGPDAPLCSLHVYAPPLQRMSQFRFEGMEVHAYEPAVSELPVTSEPASGPPSVYLNNAATTWPKPERVYDAVNRSLRAAGSLGRTARRAAELDNPLERTRARCAAFLGVSDPQRLAIVPGCTWASNIAIQSMPWKPGDRILHSALEHNSASRPCRLVGERHGVEVIVAPYRVGDPMDLDFVEDVLAHGRVRLVVATMASNVTGELLPWRELRRLSRRHGALLMLDAAQAAGVVPIDLAELQPDLAVFAGHKGLYGPPGVGLLYVAPGVEQRFFAVGGTGHDSGRLEMSAKMPAMFEVGTFNGPAIAGLEAGVRFVAEKGPENILRHERLLTSRFLAGLETLEGVRLYGHPDPERRLSVVSCRFEGRDPKAVSGWLAEQGVVTRAGFHCAPLAHQSIGSHPFGGTVRFSFGLSNTTTEIDHVLEMLREMPAELGRAEAALPSTDAPELDFEI